MAFVTDSFDETRAKILADIKNLLPSADVSEDSDFYIRASSVASVITGLYRHQAWIVRQIFPDTADTEYLEWHCRLRNITRKAQTTASGFVSGTGEPGSTADAGRTINRGSLSCTTTQAVTVGADGKFSVAAVPVVAGTAGNTTAAVTGTFTSTPPGFDSVVTIGLMAGGTERETDAEMLARLLDVIRRPPAGGNKYDYRRWAMSVDGVSAAYVYPLRRGLGTVDVVITSANGLPSADVINKVQAYIDDVRPVTAKSTMILAPTPKNVDISVAISVSGVTVLTVTQNIRDALTGYFNTLEPGESFIRSQAEMLISQISGVVDRAIVSPAGNIAATVNNEVVEWLRVGNIEVTML